MARVMLYTPSAILKQMANTIIEMKRVSLSLSNESSFVEKKKGRLALLDHDFDVAVC